MIMISLFACAELEFFSADENTTTQIWSGYVFQQTLEQESGLNRLEEGNITLENIYGEELTAATQPFEGTPSYWEFELENIWLDQEVQIRVQGDTETTVPMLWKSRTPTQNGSWLSGGLYTQERSFTESYLSTFLPEDLSIDFDDTSVSHLWGQTLSPEEWTDVSIRLFDGRGQEMEVFRYQLLENGAISENTTTGTTWFFAWNIPAGDIRLEIETSSGDIIETGYYSVGGEILSAHFYALPQKDE